MPVPRKLTKPAVEGKPSKVCAICERHLTLASFAKNSKEADGHRVDCKDCVWGKNVELQMKKSTSATASLDELRQARWDAYCAARERKEAKRKAEQVGRAEARAFEKELDRLAEKKKDVGDEPPRLRKAYPKDPKKRLKSIKKDLPAAIAVCEGQEAKLAYSMSLGITEVMDIVHSDPELFSQFEQAQNEAISQVEAALFEAAKGGSAADRRIWLQANSDKYRNRSQIEVKNVGFSPPPAESVPPDASMLTLLHGKDGTCDNE